MCNNMDLEGIAVSEMRQKKANVIRFSLCVESEENTTTTTNKQQLSSEMQRTDWQLSEAGSGVGIWAK